MAQTSVLAKIRGRLAARPDTEHEQAIVRILVGIILFLYLLPPALFGRAVDVLLLSAMVGYLVLCIAILGSIYFSSTISPVRRTAAAFIDISFTTAFMCYLGEYGAPLYVAYLLVIFGHGFRYGKSYLYYSLALSVFGFALVLAITDYWARNEILGTGLMVGMILLSLFVGKLVTRLFASLRREEEANQAKRRFLSTVSHEMRTPLNAIVGMNELLRETRLNAEQVEMVKAMREASRSMLKLIEDVLDISKIEAGKLKIEETDFDLHSLINGTVMVLAPQAEIRGLQLRANVMPEVWHSLRGDPFHVRQILYNLIGNGVKFTESGSVTLTVSSLAESDRTVRLRFEVRDTGIGIKPELQGRIFESFAQADDSTSRRYGGTGLGTTISKQLVEMMGGQIGLISDVGKGSTFWFELPFKKQAGQSPEASLRLDDTRIMLLGFSEPELQTLERDLAGWGTRTGRASGVEAAAARLSEATSLGHPYQLVLMREGPDREPGNIFAGFQGTRGQKAPPTILFTPKISELVRAEALASGFAAVLRMPYEKRLLFNAIHSATAALAGEEGVISLSAFYATRDEGRRRFQVLVAEDNAINQRVIRGILERAGHSVRVVGNGQEALDVLEGERFDVIIMDLNMPELGGLEAAKGYRFMDPESARVPIIILSADVTSEAMRECEQAGVDAFLPKPIEARRLLDTITALVDERAGAPETLGDEAQAVRAVINPSALAELELISPGGTFMQELINGFIQDGETLLRQMEAAIASGEFETFRDLVHAMKGSSVTLGAEQLCHTCVMVNGQSPQELEAEGARSLKLLRTHLQHARTSLLEYLKKNQSVAG